MRRLLPVSFAVVLLGCAGPEAVKETESSSSPPVRKVVEKPVEDAGPQAEIPALETPVPSVDAGVPVPISGIRDRRGAPDTEAFYGRLVSDLKSGKPLIITVYVALCDNDSQGIVPVKNPKICDGDAPMANMYWVSGGGLAKWAKQHGWKKRWSKSCGWVPGARLHARR